ncbi:MAG: HAD-IA family hydrolase [Bryobacteraceae bacterium]
MDDGGLRPGMAMALDMDGVIVDSNPWHVKAWMLYNRRFGIDAGEVRMERMYGRRNDEIVRDFFGPQLSAQEVAAHGAAKEELYREMLKPMLADKLEEALVPGVREFLHRHRAEPIALATNAEPANVDFILDGGGLRAYFRVVVDGHQVQHAKPHPEIYLRAAQLLAVAPRNCIVFEDSFSGVAAARAAGARIVGLRTTHRELPGVDLAIDDFRGAQLDAWLRAQVPDAS